MASLKSIENPVWSLSTIGYGVVVEGIAAIRQRMDLAIRTSKGTDPLRPEFGSYVYSFVDAPVTTAVPNIKKEILYALQMWVPEIRVTSIAHYFAAPHNPVFEITYRLTDEDLVDKLLFDLRQGGTISDALSEIILQAAFPDNPSAYRYSLSFTKNGKAVGPLPNPAGYASVQELFDWIQANWFYVGRWYMLSDRIVCYMNAEGVKSASLSVSVLPVVLFSAGFPQITSGGFLKVTFRANGVDATPAMPQTFSSPGAVLSFAQNNWSNYATWTVEYVKGASGIFSDEFSDEFAVAADGYRLVGVSNASGFVALLKIETV